MPKKKRSLDARMLIWIPLALFAIILAFLAQYKWFPEGVTPVADEEEAAVSEISNPGGMRITEAMSANKSAWADDEGKYSDWVELYNASNAPVDITGWTLTDDAGRLYPFTFPETVVQPDEYVMIYCDGTLKNTPGYAYHAPFKLSASGDSVLLFNAAGSIVESVNLPAISTNQSYARKDGTGAFEITDEYTPGMQNTEENAALMRDAAKASDSPVVLNEIMADNASYVKDEDGDYCDWVELKNTSDQAVSLKGYGLSDDEGNLYKWRFPDVSIGPNGFLLVYCSGKDKTGAELHASFKLNAEGETVVLTDASGAVADRVEFALLKTDVSYSRTEAGVWTTEQAPTPGYENDREGAAQTDANLQSFNTVGVVLNEAISSAHLASSSKKGVDWLELYNKTDHAVDLSGYGLSDDPSQPRKWQFPDGATIAAGQYLAVALNGADFSDNETQLYKTNFSLSFAGQETVTFSTPEGAIIDRMPMMGQIAGASCGRVSGQDGFFYFAESTQGAANTTKAYTGRAPEVKFSVEGGLFDEGKTITVSISAASGVVRYTTDCSEPDGTSPLYESPITLSATTILRARSFEDGKMDSLVGTESYFFGVSHTLPVISVVTDPTYLWDDKIGIYVSGEGKTKMTQKNYWKDWERAANAEYFEDGQTVFSQGIGLKLQGQYSRQQGQKGLKLIARNVYGKNTIEGKLFPNRDFTVYDSVILRASGQDANKLRFRDALLTSLAEPTTVLYQDAQPVIVYLNGEYWGHYNMRERTNNAFIARHMGWKDEEKIDIVKANGNVLQGSDDTFQSLLKWIKKNGCKSDENVEYVAQYVDIDNYLDYVALEMFTGNTDLLNVKRYRSTEGDGKWRWILFDTDTGFIYDTDSYRRWLNPDGAGSGNKCDNTLFVNLMQNKSIKEKFWRRLDDLMANYWTTEAIVAKTDEWIRVLKPEMEAQFAKWKKGSMSTWKKSYQSFVEFAKQRPLQLLKYIKDKTGLSKEEMHLYFGDIMDKLGT